MGAESETLKHLDERQGERNPERGIVGQVSSGVISAIKNSKEVEMNGKKVAGGNTG